MKHLPSFAIIFSYPMNLLYKKIEQAISILIFINGAINLLFIYLIGTLFNTPFNFNAYSAIFIGSALMIAGGILLFFRLKAGWLLSITVALANVLFYWYTLIDQASVHFDLGLTIPLLSLMLLYGYISFSLLRKPFIQNYKLVWSDWIVIVFIIVILAANQVFILREFHSFY